MFDYLQQFNKLPKELKEKVSSPAVMDILLYLEKKYNVNLAMVVMQIMVKQILFKDLPTYFSSEMNLSPQQSEALVKELREKIFFSVANYLGLKPLDSLAPEEKDLELLMKDNGIVLPGQYLLARCRNILLTYRKGIRAKIDVRSALEKPIAQGGLGLELASAERLLRALDNPKVNINDGETDVNSLNKQVQTEIDQLINRQEASSAYDLKANISKGEIKVPEVLAGKFKQAPIKLDPSHELEAPEAQKALEAPQTEGDEKKIEDIKLVDANDKILIKQELESSINEKEESSKQSVVTPNKESAESLSLPVAAAKNDIESFRKPQSSSFKSSDKSKGLFSKLFNGKQNKVRGDNPLEGMTSNHLEAMVKAASLHSHVKFRSAAASDSRLKMEDVKLKPKVMGPLEELRYMDLINFRRLGNNSEEITKKIIMKIKLLEKDGYDRMVQGVQAWRQSPVNKTYVRLMQEAVHRGVTLDIILKEKESEKKESLNKEEIAAIVEMNSKLMF